MTGQSKVVEKEEEPAIIRDFGMALLFSKIWKTAERVPDYSNSYLGKLPEDMAEDLRNGVPYHRAVHNSLCRLYGNKIKEATDKPERSLYGKLCGAYERAEEIKGKKYVILDKGDKLIIYEFSFSDDNYIVLRPLNLKHKKTGQRIDTTFYVGYDY